MPAVVWLPLRQYAHQAGIVAYPAAYQRAATEQQLQQFSGQHQHQREFQPGGKHSCE